MLPLLKGTLPYICAHSGGDRTRSLFFIIMEVSTSDHVMSQIRHLWIWLSSIITSKWPRFWLITKNYLFILLLWKVRDWQAARWYPTILCKKETNNKWTSMILRKPNPKYHKQRNKKNLSKIKKNLKLKLTKFFKWNWRSKPNLRLKKIKLPLIKTWRLPKNNNMKNKCKPS